MKKMKLILGLLAFSVVLGVSNPIMAQTPESTAAEVTDDIDDDDDTGKWGLAGLLGLLGLLGLRRRDDDKTRNINR